MEQNISQIVQKTENLLFIVKISFAYLNANKCQFFLDEIIVYQVAKQCYEYNGRTLKLCPDIAIVTICPCYFSSNSSLSREQFEY